MDDSAARKTIARTKKAFHEYQILESRGTGIVLVGREVESSRGGELRRAEAFARVERGEVWLHDMHITQYGAGSRWNVDPVRPRTLLMHNREIRKLIGATEQKGL